MLKCWARVQTIGDEISTGKDPIGLLKLIPESFGTEYNGTMELGIYSTYTIYPLSHSDLCVFLDYGGRSNDVQIRQNLFTIILRTNTAYY